VLRRRYGGVKGTPTSHGQRGKAWSGSPRQ